MLAIVSITLSTEPALARLLQVVASATRLTILRTLRTPKVLHEIVVRGTTDSPPLARQTVRRHLETLVESGLVSARVTDREYGETTEFILNHQRIYSLSEDLRGLARMRPSLEIESETQPFASVVKRIERGPVLVLVKGIDEGTTFPLLPNDGAINWVIGRRRGIAVSLDFDSSVSSENSVIRWNDRHHEVEDLGSRNGTFVNHRRLAVGERFHLQPGDILGVGRSALVYRS